MITIDEIKTAQQLWANGLVHIGQSESWDEAHSRAESVVKERYAWGANPVLFGPTKAKETQFRGTVEDAVSYFVGNNPKHPEDKGFALEPWVAVRFENTGFVCQENMAIAMGNYFFRGQDGAEVKVEFSFAYVRNEQNGLDIQLHHSALPYSG